MPKNTPYPKPRWLHTIDANTVLCLTAEELNQKTFPPPAHGVEQPPELVPTDKIWIKWFKSTSRALFANISGLNQIHQILSQECHLWNPPDLQGRFDVPPERDAALWTQFVAQAKNRSISNLIEIAKAHLTQIKSILKVEALNWPPLGHNGVDKIHRDLGRRNPDYVRNNGRDFPDLKPFVFSVFDEMGNSMGQAHLIVAQDCEWPGQDSPGYERPGHERKGIHWRSWGIVTNFSLKIVSNEVKNSYSSSSSYYSTSSKI